MAEEKVFFDDKEYLVTSLRLLIRENGATYLIREIAAPRLETEELRDVLGHSDWLIDLVDSLFSLFGKTPRRTVWMKGSHQLVVEWKGAKTIIAEHDYWVGNLRELEPEEDMGSPAWEERKKYLLRLSEAIGAAIAGA